MGVMMLVLGIQCIVQITWNPFVDPATALLVPGTLVLCYAIERLCVLAARVTRLWAVSESTVQEAMWAAALADKGSKKDEFAVPTAEEFAALAASTADAADHGLMNQRITHDTFRYRFLAANRAWLADRLGEVFTPRTLRRARPYLLAQFAKLLGEAAGGHEGGGGGSDDEDDEDDDGGGGEGGEGGGQAGGRAAFKPVEVDRTQRDIVRGWLQDARRRLALRRAVQPLAARAIRERCDACQARAGLTVVPARTVEAVAEEFEAEFPTGGGGGSGADLDVQAWRDFYLRRTAFATLCGPCAAAARSVANEVRGATRGAADLAEEAPAFARPPAPGARPLALSPAERRVLDYWLAAARAARRAARDRNAQEAAGGAYSPPAPQPRTASADRRRQQAAQRDETDRLLLQPRGLQQAQPGSEDVTQAPLGPRVQSAFLPLAMPAAAGRRALLAPLSSARAAPASPPQQLPVAQPPELRQEERPSEAEPPEQPQFPPLTSLPPSAADIAARWLQQARVARRRQ